MTKRVLLSLALVSALAFAISAPWMVEGFKVTYYQEVKNSGLLALRGKALYSNITIEILKVIPPSTLKIKIYGNLTLVGVKNVTQVLNRTLTVNLSDKNVSLPMLTEGKFKELLKQFPHQCSNGTCVVYVNQTQKIPQRAMLIVIKGKNVIDKKLLIIKDSELEMDVYVTSAKGQRLLGKSIAKSTLVSYYVPKASR